jgi:hypothetical protein
MSTAARRLSREELDAAWNAAWRRIFSGRRTDEGAFLTHLDWELVLVPRGLRMPDDYFAAIAAAAGAMGDHTAVVKAMDADRRDVDWGELGFPAFEVEWTHGAFDIVKTSVLRLTVSYLWGRSARWGLISEVDFACLGGPPEFMRAVTRPLGGREVMRRRFLLFEENEWFAPEEQIDRVFGAVGWSRTIDG